MHPPVLAYFDARRHHDLPGMTVRIGEVTGVAAIIGLVSELQQRRPSADRKIHYRIDFLCRAAIPGERHAAEAGWPWRDRKRDVFRELVPGKKPEHGAAGVEECNDVAGCLKFSCEAQGWGKLDAAPHVADAERDDRETWNRRRRCLIHVMLPSLQKPDAIPVIQSRCATT